MSKLAFTINSYMLTRFNFASLWQERRNILLLTSSVRIAGLTVDKLQEAIMTKDAFTADAVKRRSPERWQEDLRCDSLYLLQWRSLHAFQ